MSYQLPSAVCFAEADLREERSLPPAALDLSKLQISVSLSNDVCMEEEEGRLRGGKLMRLFRDRDCRRVLSTCAGPIPCLQPRWR